jgi:hypothetical protein
MPVTILIMRVPGMVRAVDPVVMFPVIVLRVMFATMRHESSPRA